MEKFISSKHSGLQKKQPFSYFSSDVYLDWSGYVFERNDESLIVWQDTMYQHEFPAIFTPKNKKNFVRCSIAFATKKDVENIEKENIKILINKPMGAEFFYKTENFTNPKSDLKNRINKFAQNYKYSLSHKESKKSIVDFYHLWKLQREHRSSTFQESEDFFYYCLNNLEKYNIKQVYVEVDGKIVGLAWGAHYPNSSNWIGLHLKVNYRYTGLSRFLHHERAKLFSDCDVLSLGTSAHDKGIDQFKEDLGPTYKKEYFYILTGEKLNISPKPNI